MDKGFAVFFCAVKTKTADFDFSLGIIGKPPLRAHILGKRPCACAIFIHRPYEDELFEAAAEQSANYAEAFCRPTRTGVSVETAMFVLEPNPSSARTCSASTKN